jgi:hypothetical protein
MNYRPLFRPTEEDWEVYEALLKAAESFIEAGGKDASEAPSVRGAILFALTTLDTAVAFTLAGVPLVEAVE